MRGRAVEHVARHQIWRRRNDCFGLICFVFGSNEHLGAAVVDDVGKFVGGEAARATGVDQSGVVTAPHGFKKPWMILEADGHVIARLQPVAGHQLADAVGAFVKLAIGEGFTRASHHDDGAVGGSLGNFSGEHGDSEDSAKAGRRLLSSHAD